MRCHDCEFRPELYYDREYQIWVRLDGGPLLAVGITDISQSVAGKILHVRVRRPGTHRPAGKPVATLESGKWAGPVPNPFDCVIEEANPEVLDNPAMLNASPFEAWIARVRASASLDESLQGLVTGPEAQQGYCARCERENIRCERR